MKIAKGREGEGVEISKPKSKRETFSWTRGKMNPVLDKNSIADGGSTAALKKYQAAKKGYQAEKKKLQKKKSSCKNRISSCK